MSSKTITKISIGIIIITIILISVFVLANSAQPSTDTNEESDSNTEINSTSTQKNYGSIDGVIKGYTTGRPISEANLLLCPVLSLTEFEFRNEIKAKTNSDGSFSITNVLPGSYVVVYSLNEVDLSGTDLIGKTISHYNINNLTNSFDSDLTILTADGQGGIQISNGAVSKLIGGAAIFEQLGLIIEFREGQPITITSKVGETSLIEIRATESEEQTSTNSETESESENTTPTTSYPEIINDPYEPDNSFEQYSIMTVNPGLQSQDRHIGPSSTDEHDFIRFYANPGIYTFNITSSTWLGARLWDINWESVSYWYVPNRTPEPVEIQDSGYYFLQITNTPTTDHGLEGNYTLYINYDPAGVVSGDVYEPDNTFNQYSSISVEFDLQFQNRSLTTFEDEDYIRFYAERGTYIFSVKSEMSVTINVYDSNHESLNCVYSSNEGLLCKEYDIEESGYYFLKIGGQGVMDDGVYELYYQMTTFPALVELPAAISSGLVSASITGNGLQLIDVEIRSTAETRIYLTIPVCTIFDAQSVSVQNMVTRVEKELIINPEEIRTLTIAAACANMMRDTPEETDQFNVMLVSPPEDLVKLLNLNDFTDFSARVQQFAIWTITDNPTPSGYIQLGYDNTFSGPSEQEMQTIEELFNKAEINTQNYNAFQ